MKIPVQTKSNGIAIIIVMIAILVLSIMAAGFAYSMKVETKLAQNAENEEQLLWLGRSGVELARWVLAQEKCPYDSLNQIWAGGREQIARPMARWPEFRWTIIKSVTGRFRSKSLTSNAR